MKKTWPDQQDYRFIELAQYLSGLTTQQDIWSEVGKALVNFLSADLVAFAGYGADGGIIEHHWTFSSQECGSKTLSHSVETLRQAISKHDTEIKEGIAETLESGFLTSRLLFTPTPFSLTFLPIIQESQVTAVMFAGYKMSEPFPKDLLNAYLAVAGLVGTTVARLTSEIELRKYRQQLERLVIERTAQLTKTNEQLQLEIDQRKAAEEALLLEKHNLIRILEAMQDCIYIVNTDYEIQYVNPAFSKVFPDHEGRKCYELLNESTQECPWCNIHDVCSGKTMRREWYLPKNKKTYDIIETPLRYEDKSISMLTIFRDITERKLTEEKLMFMATTDELTGLYNRRYFLESAKKELKRAQRYDHHFSFMMLDIDHFKKINDTFGHAVGDLALRHLASIMNNSLREVDIKGRLGGEEFCILLPGTKLDNAVLLAERMRKKIENTPFNNYDKAITFTVSIGVTAYSSGIKNIDELLIIADDGLYEAKALGRNCVVKNIIKNRS